MGAPVCNINPKSPVPASKAPALPSIPVATDLATALAAINALRQWIIQFTSPLTTNPGPTTGPGGFQQPSPTTVNVPGGGAVGNFSENTTKRVITTTRIYDPNDPTKQTYIDVQQITGLQFVNKSGQTIVWAQGTQP